MVLSLSSSSCSVDYPKRYEDLKSFLQFTITEVLKILIYYNVLHFFLKRLRQPSVISQYIVGLIVGNTLSTYAKKIQQDITSIQDFMDTMTLFGSYLFMFLIGVEMDLAYLHLSLHRSACLAFGGMIASTALLPFVSRFLYNHLASIKASRSMFIVTLALFVSNTASPVIIRIVTELKLTSSNMGRLAITTGFMCDLTTVMGFLGYSFEKTINMYTKSSNRLFYALGLLVIFVIGPLGIPWGTRIVNRTHQNRRYVGLSTLMLFIGFISSISWVADHVGFSGTTLSFIIGLLMPREGPTTRTMLDKLQYPVHNILLPLYFTQLASKADLKVLAGSKRRKVVICALLVTAIGMVGKVVSTVLVATIFLRMPAKESFVLGMLLNVKGHSDAVLLQMGDDIHLWASNGKLVLLLSILMSTIIAGPMSSLVVWWERRSYQYEAQSLENLGPDSQLRVLACVHEPRGVSPMLTLAALCKGDGVSLMAVYLQHLIELTQKYTVTLMYHQRSSEGLDLDDDDDIVRQVSVAIDMTNRDTGIPVREMRVVAKYAHMHEDIFMGAEEVRATIIILPFHKEQRYDGRMVCRKEERRELNNKIIQRAPCTVGILVDRPFSSCNVSYISSKPSAPNSTAPTDIESEAPATPTDAQLPLNKIVAIFFGGPNDREAATLMVRMATHPFVEASLVRFLPEFRTDENDMSWASSRFASQIPMIPEDDEETEADEQFISKFKESYVEKGILTFEERYVRNGSETVTALSSMAGLYSLFIVGKTGSRISPMMRGMTDWEECSELGPIGDLLASEDFMDSGSVLIIQQHSVKKQEKKSSLGGEDNQILH